MKPFVLLLPACLALGACVESHTHHHHQGGMAHQGGQSHMGSPNMGGNMGGANVAGGRFSCQNGLSVSINYLDTERVEIKMDDKFATLYRAPAASGELFSDNIGLFDKDTSWHQKGNEAVFSFVDPYGNRTDTVCRK